jgi:hypothetical protein
LKCGQLWDDVRAQDNELICTRRCGGQLVPVAPLALPDLEGCDFSRLPYPVALTAQRLAAALRASGDVLKTLFLLKDCFEATIKYLGAVLLADYRLGSACTPEHNASLLEKMIRPSLGVWVDTVVGSLSRWLVGDSRPGGLVANLFMTPGKKPRETELFAQCRAFVEYRNVALGHGAMRSDRVYDADLRTWMPRLRELLDGVAAMAEWRLCLPTDHDRCRVWMGSQPGDATEPGDFTREQVGRFVLRGPDGPVRDLYPFLCYLPDSQQERRLHFYDSVCRYSTARKEVEALEYDHGFKQASAEPVAGLEEAFTADLLAKAFGRHRERMAVVEGRVANFGELIEAHAAIVGRRFAIDYVCRFLAEHDRGVLVIEAQPGKGKTALMAHLIQEVFGHYAPRPVHFFYRRTAGITDPNVCVRSLYHALLEAHGITEAEESKQKNSPEEVYVKLTNLLIQEIAPRLLPDRPQLLFIDALDEASANAFQRIPEEVPAGVYVIATSRPVSDRAALARRQNLHWYHLDAPDLLQENLRDGFEYVERELVGTELPNQTLAEIARIGAGNFLVLKLLCQHLRTTLSPDQVAAFVRRLATDGGTDQLGFIYAEFWNRLTERCTRADVNLLCDVAGVLVTAHAPLTADMVCGVLVLRAGDWDFALRHLAEYLAVVEHDEDGVREASYRVYHESFADFLRAKVEIDRERICNRLSDYCLKWSQLAEGYGRVYGLRFGPRHLLEVDRSEEAAALLLDLVFLEAKTEGGMVLDLADDFAAVAVSLSEEDGKRQLLEHLREALSIDMLFLARHPKTLFQCLWNRGWWYDSPEAAQFYGPPAGGWPAQGPPWDRPAPRLCRLLESWRAAKEQASPGFVWLRCVHPPRVHVGTRAQDRTLRSADGQYCATFSTDGRYLVVGEKDGKVRVWDIACGSERACFQGPAERVRDVMISDTSRYVGAAFADNAFAIKTISLWDNDSNAELASLRFESDDSVRVWHNASGTPLANVRFRKDKTAEYDDPRGLVPFCLWTDGKETFLLGDTGDSKLETRIRAAELDSFRLGNAANNQGFLRILESTRVFEEIADVYNVCLGASEEFGDSDGGEWRAVTKESGTVIESRDTGAAVAWFPINLERESRSNRSRRTTHASGRMWCGEWDGRIYLLELEGDPRSEHATRPQGERPSHSAETAASGVVPIDARLVEKARGYCHCCGDRLPRDIGNRPCPKCQAAFDCDPEKTYGFCGICDNIIGFDWSYCIFCGAEYRGLRAHPI